MWAILTIPILVVVFWLCTLKCIRRFVFQTHLHEFPKHLTIGFFHPYCNAGGGGERVLWCGLKALDEIRRADLLKCIIYTVEEANASEILSRTEQRFGIDLTKSRFQLEFVRLQNKELIEASRWPKFTMLGQSLGSMILTWQALRKFRPDVFIDTTGFAFSFVIAKLFAQSRVAAYVHYPTITTEMLDRVQSRTTQYNNNNSVTKSKFATFAKTIYYRLFARLYGMAGKLADVVMVNSTWTKGHIDSLWSLPRTVSISENIKTVESTIVYPPCNVTELASLPLRIGQRKPHIVSVGQFRPEKDHSMQIHALAELKKKFSTIPTDDISQSLSESNENKPSIEVNNIKLILVGSCRHEEDHTRVNALKELAKELDVENMVEFRLNVSWTELKQILGECQIGIHTMWNEHFGISVVELMASGTITIAHNSGGPKLDIVTPCCGNETGYLASIPTEYANCIMKILQASAEEKLAMVTSARTNVQRFSDSEFATGFHLALISLLDETAAQKFCADTLSGRDKPILGVGGVSSPEKTRYTK